MHMSRRGPRVLSRLGWLALAAGFCFAQNFQEFATPGFSPYSIAAGPDGALWFTGTSGTVGRMTTAGNFSQYSLPANGFPQPIVAAPDHALWAQVGSNQVARINTAGAVVDNSVNDGALVWSMTIGPDNAIWLTDGGIGRLTTTGAFTQFSTGNYIAFGITTGADGNLWFSANDFTSGGGVIGRMTTGGAVAAFPLGKQPGGEGGRHRDGRGRSSLVCGTGLRRRPVEHWADYECWRDHYVRDPGFVLLQFSGAFNCGRKRWSFVVHGEWGDRADYHQRKPDGVSVRGPGNPDCGGIGRRHVVHRSVEPDAVARGGDGSSPFGAGDFADQSEYDRGQQSGDGATDSGKRAGGRFIGCVL